MTQKLKPDDVSKIATLDDVRETVFYRDPDRPDSRFVKTSRRVPQEVRRAQQRMRTARWRSEMDRRKAPTIRDIGMAMAVALATSRLDDLTSDDRRLVEKTLHHLQANGFSVDEAKATLRRLRRRLVDPADREEGEATESCAPALLANDFLETQLEGLRKQVSTGYARGRLPGTREQRGDPDD